MRVLNQTEAAEWFEARRLPADPYDRDDFALPSYFQFYPPQGFRSIEAFTKSFINTAGPEEGLLMSVMDPVMPWDFELRTFEKLRPRGSPSLRAAPWHLFEPAEWEDAITMFTLTAGFQWKVYLHVPSTRSILYNWEGDIFDFWTANRAVFEQMSDLLSSFQLKSTDQPA